MASLSARRQYQAWQVTWENTVAAAKKEGRLNFYVGRYGSEKLLNEFRKEFPEIKIFSTNGAGNSLGTRIVAEARAGNVLADLYSGGSVTNFEILYKGKILGFAQVGADTSRKFSMNPSGTAASTATTIRNSSMYSFTWPIRLRRVFISIPISSIRKNSNPIWDLVNPKWKGKYVSQEPSSTGIGPSLQFFFYHPELGADFLRKLFIDQQPVYGRDRRQITDWLAQGKFALCVGCRDSDEPASKGCRWTIWIWSIGRKVCRSLPAAARSVSSRAGPHPNAAKVFINWFLSRKGQIALQKYEDLYGQEPPNSRRIDIPKDMLPPSSRLVEGRRYFDFTDPKYADMTPILSACQGVHERARGEMT